LSQEQVPSLHIQHLPNRLRFTLQQKIARAAQYDTKKLIPKPFGGSESPLIWRFIEFLRSKKFACKISP
jgi:hypothetical protein